jgi:hypothetical protein
MSILKELLLSMTCIVSMAVLSAHGTPSQDVFETVPESLRAHLVGWTKAEFVRIHQQYPGVAGTARRLVTFDARDVRLRDGSDHDWVISGCQISGPSFSGRCFRDG